MTSERKRKIPLILGACIFLVSGMDGLYFQDFLVGTTSLIAGVLNIVAVRYLDRFPRLVEVSVHVVNALVGAVMTASAIMAGKQYIQFAWIFVVFLYATVAVVTGLRNHGGSQES